MALVLLVLSTVCAVIPMLVFLTVVWWMDRYDREPVWLLILTFLWGAIGSILIALVGSTLVMIPATLLLGWIDIGLVDAFGATVAAPLVEEPAKALFLLFVLWNRHFDNMTDGFVYGAAAGLGFGMTENFLYFADVGTTGDLTSWVWTVIIRTLYSAVMHAMATSVVGAALGFARFRGCGALALFGFLGLLVAMGIHALWNGLLTLEGMTGGTGTLFGANLLLLPLELLVLFVIFQLCLYEESVTIRRELREEAANGVIPQDHPRILASWILRHRTSWLPRGVDHPSYVEAATSLAMRKKQARLASGEGSWFYRDEVERLRRRVRQLLEPRS